METSITVGIPFDALPALKVKTMNAPRMTWIVDRARLLELLAPRYEWRPSMNTICKDAGLGGSRSYANWSEAAVTAIANHFGLEPTQFATPRPHATSGRPKAIRSRQCPKLLTLPEEHREMITQASAATGMTPVEWVQTVLQACATFTVRQEARQ